MSIDLTRHDVRRLLGSVLGSDGAFDAFCSDFFPERFRKFSRGMNREEKTTLLLEEEENERVVAALRQASPVEAARHLGIELPAGPTARRTHRRAEAETRSLNEEVEAAKARREELEREGAPTDDANQQILAARRALREGGRLCAGDSLGDGRYLLLKLLGRGGFGSVWEAKDRDRDAVVAIKVLHAMLADDPIRKDRFFRGARAMAKLDHPAIVKVLVPEAEDGGFHFFVMEFVNGEDLHRAVINGRMPKEEVLRVVLHVGEALAVAHDRGLVHRDVKPANILLDRHGGVKLTDFDLVGDAETTGGTRTGAMGTLRYAAPECLDKPQQADARADVYGLGMTTIFGLHGAELPATVLRDVGTMIDGLDCEYAVKWTLKRATDWDKCKRFMNVRQFCTELQRASAATLLENVPLPLWAPDLVPQIDPSSQPSATSPALNGSKALVLLPPTPQQSSAPDKLGKRPGSALQGGARSLALMLLTSLAGSIAWGFLGCLRTCISTTLEKGGEQGPASAKELSSASPETPGTPTGQTAKAPTRIAPAGICPKGSAPIPGGSFQMGNNLFADEKPVHLVAVATFCLDLTEVTVDAYTACVQKKKCSEEYLVEYIHEGKKFFPSKSCNYNVSGRGDHPINCVNWHQALAYCNSQDKRLPTEEEWEYAARGGDEQRNFPWGNAAPSDQLCWTGRERDGGKEQQGTCAVGKYPAGDSLWQTHDMAGNVWEWTSSSYCPYREGTTVGGCSESRRVLRGGSSSSPESHLRAALRQGATPEGPSGSNIGFRCARGVL